MRQTFIGLVLGVALALSYVYYHGGIRITIPVKPDIHVDSPNINVGPVRVPIWPWQR